MSIEKVREYFKGFGIEDKILEFDVSSATVALAAQALGCAEQRIAKTLSLLVDEKAVLIVCAGDVKIDNPKFKAQFHTKAKMIPFASVEEYLGHPPGGVCPFALKEGVKVYLDVSLRAHETVFPAAGSENSAVETTVDQLERLTSFEEWVDVCKK